MCQPSGSMKELPQYIYENTKSLLTFRGSIDLYFLSFIFVFPRACDTDKLRCDSWLLKMTDSHGYFGGIEGCISNYLAHKKLKPFSMRAQIRIFNFKFKILCRDWREHAFNDSYRQYWASVTHSLQPLWDQKLIFATGQEKVSGQSGTGWQLIGN